jgi:beta-amylase
MRSWFLAFHPRVSVSPKLSGLTRSGARTVNVMAPLRVADADWKTFEKSLAEIKALGADAVSTDVWWGLIEPKDHRFDFRYYDRIAKAVEDAGLRWVPILSFHQCGGNVGDDVTVSIPEWVGPKYASLNPRAADEDAAFFRSEQGNVCHEALSVWASRFALSDYEEVMRAFQSHFADKRHLIAEINISLGPAGELRYPSYNSHDVGTSCPTRGAIQAYSSLAKESFRDAMLKKYGCLENVVKAWSKPLSCREDIRPPDGDFFSHHEEHSAYGRDFFDWYSGSLQEHGRRILTKAVEVFDGPHSPFRGIDIGAKVPGIHWRAASDRAAELAAGLLQTSQVSTWNDDRRGHGYAQIVDVFHDVGEQKNAPNVVLHYTALEMDDGAGGPAVASQAKSLVFWIAKEAERMGVTIKGENALSGSLATGHAWDNLVEAIEKGTYQGITVLRMNDVVSNPVAREKFEKVAQRVHQR